MAAQSLSLIFDDTALEATYGGVKWITSTLPGWYNGSAVYPELSAPGTASFSFQGTSIAFYGTTPLSSTDIQILTVAIDAGIPYNTTYNDSVADSYGQWYQSPTLAEGKHIISLSHIAGTVLDFAVVTVAANTPLAGTKVIVDNEDPSINYNGSWTLNTTEFVPDITQSPGFPYHTSTRQSVTSGDSFSFRFTGSSVSVYGIMNWVKLGSFGATYILDGALLGSQTYSVTQSTPQLTEGLGDQNNYLLYNADSLQPEDHTLVVIVTNVTNQIFIFDYITYRPTFSSLATMPNLTAGVSSTATGGSSTSSLAGAIAGGVVGILILLSAVAVFFYRFAKRNASQTSAQNNTLPIHTVPQPFNPQNMQQTPSSPSNGNTISPFLDAGATQDGLVNYGIVSGAQRKQVLHSQRRSSTTPDDRKVMSDTNNLVGGDDIGTLARGRSDPGGGNENVSTRPPSYDNIPGNSQGNSHQPVPRCPSYDMPGNSHQ